jgi:hypothetical protein
VLRNCRLERRQAALCLPGFLQDDPGDMLMKPHRSRTLMDSCRHALLLAAAVLALPATSLAQAWPAKPVKIIVNFPPGGAADQIARPVGKPFQEALVQPVFI